MCTPGLITTCPQCHSNQSLKSKVLPQWGRQQGKGVLPGLSYRISYPWFQCLKLNHRENNLDELKFLGLLGKLVQSQAINTRVENMNNRTKSSVGGSWNQKSCKPGGQKVPEGSWSCLLMSVVRSEYPQHGRAWAGFTESSFAGTNTQTRAAGLCVAPSLLLRLALWPQNSSEDWLLGAGWLETLWEEM